MKIVFAHDHKFREINGAYYSPGGLSNEILTRYTDIFGNVNVIARVIQEKKDDKKLSEIKNSKIKIVKANCKGKAKFIIEEYVKECDGVIARLPSFIGNIAVGMAKKYNKPYLIEMVGCPWDSLWNHSVSGKIIAPYMFFKTKHLVKKAPYILYVTNNFLQNRYPTNGISIGCSDVSLLPLDERVLERRLNKIKQIKKDKPVILGTTAAVNVRYKSQEYVIEAISKLNKQGYNFEYYLAGNGDNSYLKSLAEKYCVTDKVKFLGLLPHNKVFEYLDNIDIYIQPSKQEGLPRALVEAMSRGCPSLGSTTGGIPELLNDKFIFHNGAVNEICKLLKNMDKETMIKEAKRSFEKAKEYDKELLDKKRNTFYQKFIKKLFYYNTPKSEDM